MVNYNTKTYSVWCSNETYTASGGGGKRGQDSSHKQLQNDTISKHHYNPQILLETILTQIFSKTKGKAIYNFMQYHKLWKQMCALKNINPYKCAEFHTINLENVCSLLKHIFFISWHRVSVHFILSILLTMFKYWGRCQEVCQRVQVDGETCISPRLERQLCLEVLLAPLEHLFLHGRL